MSLDRDLAILADVTKREGALVMLNVAAKIAGMNHSSLISRAKAGGVGRLRLFGRWWYSVAEMRRVRVETDSWGSTQ